MNTRGFGGRNLNKGVTVSTNDKNQSTVQLTVKGPVEQFAAITPAQAVLQGEVGEEIQANLKIVPQAKYPFRIVGSHAKAGKNARFELSENVDTGETEYLLTVTNLQKEPGRYSDIIFLDTDSRIKPQIEIRVSGNIKNPAIATIAPQRIILRGSPDAPLAASVRIVAKDGFDFKVTNAKADDGKEIRFTFEPLKEGESSGYVVTVENQKKEKGQYRDTIRLMTTSETQPEIIIPVLGIIN